MQISPGSTRYSTASRPSVEAQDRARYFIGAGLMLIAVTVFIGLIAVKLTADGFGNTHAAQKHSQINTAKHLAQQSPAPYLSSLGAGS